MYSWPSFSLSSILCSTVGKGIHNCLVKWQHARAEEDTLYMKWYISYRLLEHFPRITDQVSSNVSKEVLWAKFKFLNEDFIVSTGEGYENNILQEGNVAILHELKVKIILLTMRSSSMLSSSDKSATIEDVTWSVLFNGFVSLLTILVMSNFLPYIT